MMLYLIRHAEAGALQAGGSAHDFDRPLTEHGRTQARNLARAFAARKIVVDAVCASPLVRAYQTAVEFLTVLAPGQRPITCDTLAIDRLKPVHLSNFLAHLPPSGERIPTREEKAVAAIGHMPDLGFYLEWLLGAATGTVHLAKASAACIRFPDAPIKASGKLQWLITPEWFGIETATVV